MTGEELPDERQETTGKVRCSDAKSKAVSVGGLRVEMTFRQIGKKPTSLGFSKTTHLILHLLFDALQLLLQEVWESVCGRVILSYFRKS